MHDPGLGRHEWDGEWEALGDGVRDDPAGALPELDELVGRMLEESGYDLTDPVVREGDEREIVAEYLAAHEIVLGAARDSTELSPGTSPPLSTGTTRSTSTWSRLAPPSALPKSCSAAVGSRR